jgi:N-acyl-D-amino-acid deacylase
MPHANAKNSGCLIACAISLLAAAVLHAEEPKDAEGNVRSAVQKSIALLEASAKEYRNHRECFSCHHQALPTLALVEARKRGFTIDEENLRTAVELTHKHLEGGRDRYLDGRGQGGKADTAGYALWTLSAGEWKSDETTAAVAEYLVSYQNDDDHWKRTSKRPPSEASDFTTTFLAIRGLQSFATEEQKEKVAERFTKAREWLASAAGEDTEDRVFRLRALRLLEADESTIRDAVDALLSRQRDDGGWSQTDDLQSDAYATGSVLAALHQAGNIATCDTVYQRGVAFLLQSQLDDGSWHVTSRSDPFQTYFESGFPHGNDQFISIAASSWATIALTLSLPEDAE